MEQHLEQVDPCDVSRMIGGRLPQVSVGRTCPRYCQGLTSRPQHGRCWGQNAVKQWHYIFRVHAHDQVDLAAWFSRIVCKDFAAGAGWLKLDQSLHTWRSDGTILPQALEIIPGRFGFLCGPPASFDQLQAACGAAHILYCIDDELVGWPNRHLCVGFAVEWRLHAIFLAGEVGDMCLTRCTCAAGV